MVRLNVIGVRAAAGEGLVEALVGAETGAGALVTVASGTVVWASEASTVT